MRTTDGSSSAFFSRRRRGMPAVAKLVLIVGLFVVIEAALLALSYVGMTSLSAARAFVTGGALWTKAQKEAVYRLRRYAVSRDEWDYEGYRQAIAVTLGDRQARIELSKPEPDMAKVYAGFLQGGNHPDDVQRMARLYRLFGRVDLFARSAATWESADNLVSTLQREAIQLREIIRGGGRPAEVDAVMRRINRLDSELTELENTFTSAMSAGARELERRVFVALAVVSLLLLLTALFLSAFLLRSVKRSEEALQISERRYRALAEASAVGIWHIDPRGETRYLNPAMARMLEVESRAELRGRTYHPFFTTESLARIERERSERGAGEASTYEAQLVGRRGSHRTVLVSGAPILDQHGELEGNIGTFIDISERKAAEELLEHQALHDPLTDLPNRSLFIDRLEQALRRAARGGSALAVLFVDLDRFKVINDSLGHVAGDVLLVRVGERLRQAVRRADTVARLGGDEFAVLLEDLHETGEALETAQRVAQTLREPLEVEGTPVRFTASIGIAFHESPDQGKDTLLRHADIAMYAAKRQGGGRHHVFDPASDAMEKVQLELEGALWQALERDQMKLVLQPVVDLETNRVVGAEALLRWDHPTQGRLYPGSFLPLAEETGAIEPLGLWVLDRACALLARWRDHPPGDRDLWVGVNLSERQVRSAELAERVDELLERHGAPADRLHLEISESILLQVAAPLDRLRALGTPVVVDDFGTGYSSLRALKNLRVASLKIDRAFVQGLEDGSAESAALISAATHVASALGLRVTAEGVESAEELAEVRRLGCRQAQGFHLARPMEAAELEGWLEARET